tara:strand:+ start:84 stop:461 length:378 start_codon:yes stop_codon:yes gene_type:complete
MTDPTTSTGQGDDSHADLKAAMPSGAEVHDALMKSIDEDLLTTNLPSLDEKYADETPEERSARAERYKAALVQYDTAFEAWEKGVDGKVDAYKQSVLSHAKEQSGESDADKMSELESEISDHNES